MYDSDHKLGIFKSFGRQAETGRGRVTKGRWMERNR
jgi:hypothetical protein